MSGEQAEKAPIASPPPLVPENIPSLPSHSWRNWHTLSIVKSMRSNIYSKGRILPPRLAESAPKVYRKYINSVPIVCQLEEVMRINSDKKGVGQELGKSWVEMQWICSGVFAYD